MKIAVLVGSLRQESYNKTLARVIESRLPQDVEFDWLELADVPFMNEDLESDVPASVRRVADQVAQADGLLILSPEYNRGIPAVTKNAVDWLSRGSTGNTINGKPTAIGGITVSPIKTLVMQSQLRPILAHVGAPVMTGPVLSLTVGEDNMTAAGELAESTKPFVDKFIQSMQAHIELHTK